jgi:hypothetical protein
LRKSEFADASSELADVESAEDCKTALLSVPRLVWTRATSSACPTMLGEGVWGVVWVEIYVPSMFSLF